MAKNTVHCDMCGKAFFPSSLPIHVKTCAVKMALIEVPCFYCRQEFPRGEMAAHHLKCKEAKKVRKSEPNINRAISSVRSTSNQQAAQQAAQKTCKTQVADVGDYVELYGLTGKPEMNGLRGVITQPVDISTGRLSVKIDDKETVCHLKPTSVKLVPTPTQHTMNHPNSTTAKQSKVSFAQDTIGNDEGKVSINAAISGGAFDDGFGNGGKMDCAVCGRSFAIDRISVHQRICDKLDKKAKMNPRKVFPAKKGRYDPEVMAAKRNAGPSPPRPKSKWRQQHLQFQSIVRGARVQDFSASTSSVKTSALSGGESGGISGGYDSDLVPCPHCGRTFAPLTAERHIPKCQHIINKPKAPPGMRGTPTNLKEGDRNRTSNGMYSQSSPVLRPSSQGPMRGRGRTSMRSTGPTLPPMNTHANAKSNTQFTQQDSSSQYTKLPKSTDQPRQLLQQQPRQQQQHSLGIIRNDHVEDWIGHRAIVVGTERADMNGQSGICDSVVNDRVIVVLNDGRRLGVRTINLVEDTDIDVIPVDSSNFSLSSPQNEMFMKNTADASTSGSSKDSRLKQHLNNARSMDSGFATMGRTNDGLSETMIEGQHSPNHDSTYLGSTSTAAEDAVRTLNFGDTSELSDPLQPLS